MTDNIKINIESIEAFKNISNSSLSLIDKEAEFLRYSIGQPISSENIIPNQIFIILSGEARVIHSEGNETYRKNSISIIGSDNFIGLTSLLRASSCEEINARTNVLVMSITDKLILNLYNNLTI